MTAVLAVSETARAGWGLVVVLVLFVLFCALQFAADPEDPAVDPIYELDGIPLSPRKRGPG